MQGNFLSNVMFSNSSVIEHLMKVWVWQTAICDQVGIGSVDLNLSQVWGLVLPQGERKDNELCAKREVLTRGGNYFVQLKAKIKNVKKLFSQPFRGMGYQCVKLGCNQNFWSWFWYVIFLTYRCLLPFGYYCYFYCNVEVFLLKQQ